MVGGERRRQTGIRIQFGRQSAFSQATEILEFNAMAEQ
jgi:hypothetical protein